MEEVLVSKKLVLGFRSSAENKISLHVYNPLSNLTGEVVSQAMRNMLGKQILQDTKGSPAASVDGAKIVSVTEKPLF